MHNLNIQLLIQNDWKIQRRRWSDRRLCPSVWNARIKQISSGQPLICFGENKRQDDGYLFTFSFSLKKARPPLLSVVAVLFLLRRAAFVPLAAAVLAALCDEEW